MNKIFMESIKNNNFELFRTVEKTNYHTHALLSSNRNIFYNEYKRQIERFKQSDNIMSLSTFIKDNILDISITKEGQLKLYELTILTAIYNGVTILDTSIDYRVVKDHYNNYNEFINDLHILKDKYKEQITVNFDLGISRNNYKKEDFKIIKNMICSYFFHGIDLFGNELSCKINKFKKIYKLAKKHNMILKAHVGEFGTSKSILKAIKILKLDVVQHGINIVNDKKIMKKISKTNVIFNVCPISNLKLMRVEDIKKHPIREMFDNDLKITINTDDELIFENSLFDEYRLLYTSELFTLEELDQIRELSIKMFSN